MRFYFLPKNDFCHIYIGKFISMSFGVCNYFTFNNTKCFELCLRIPNYNNKKRYNDESYSYNKSYQHGKRSPVDND